jgi:membrane fusion protein, heavy metal efflux system
MFTRSNGALRRLQAMLAGLGLLTTIAAAAVAHEGHDHGAPPPAAVTTGNPRVTAQSDAYELVGVLRGDRLGIYLDRFASNEPVTDAKIAVTVGGDEDVQAEAAPDGTYTVTSPKFAGEGPLELIFAVTAPSGDDLLIGTLQLPGKPVAAAPAPAGGSPLQVLQIGVASKKWRAVWCLSGQPFELNWTDIVQCRVTPDRVVEAVDVPADGLLGLSPGLEHGAPDQFGL